MPIVITGQGTFNNGGTAKLGSTSLKEIKFGTTTVWKAEVDLITTYCSNITLAAYNDDGTTAAWRRNSYSTDANRSTGGTNGNVTANTYFYTSTTVSGTSYTNVLREHSNHSTIGYNMCYIRSGSTIPLGSYSKLTLSVIRSGTRTGNAPVVGFSSDSTKEFTYVNYPSSLSLSGSTTLGSGASQTINIDLSSLTGSKYFYFAWNTGNNPNGPTDENWYITKAILT